MDENVIQLFFCFCFSWDTTKLANNNNNLNVGRKKKGGVFLKWTRSWHLKEKGTKNWLTHKQSSRFELHCRWHSFFFIAGISEIYSEWNPNFPLSNFKKKEKKNSTSDSALHEPEEEEEEEKRQLFALKKGQQKKQRTEWQLGTKKRPIPSRVWNTTEPNVVRVHKKK